MADLEAVLVHASSVAVLAVDAAAVDQHLLAGLLVAEVVATAVAAVAVDVVERKAQDEAGSPWAGHRRADSVQEEQWASHLPYRATAAGYHTAHTEEAVLLAAAVVIVVVVAASPSLESEHLLELLATETSAGGVAAIAAMVQVALVV